MFSKACQIITFSSSSSIMVTTRLFNVSPDCPDWAFTPDCPTGFQQFILFYPWESSHLPLGKSEYSNLPLSKSEESPKLNNSN